MQAGTPINVTLNGYTVLVAPSGPSELTTELERYGARVLAWPKLDVRAIDNCDALDESIENLFGYDWLIFRNAHAVDFFLHRFQELGHEISELDALRVCGPGEDTTHKLEAAQVHLDVIPDRVSSPEVRSAIEIYAGGPDYLRGLNFLIPGAAALRDYLAEALQDASARVDTVAAYRTCSANDPAMTRISTLLKGGGIDCVAFITLSELREFAAVFDTNDLGRLLTGVAVACIDETIAVTAAEFSLTAEITSRESSATSLAQAIAFYLSERSAKTERSQLR